MHPMSRNVARVAAIAAVTVSSGALVAVPPAVADIGADMTFVCTGEAGTHEVGLRVETSVPTSGAVGEPVQPGTVRVDVGVPAELVDEAIGKSPDDESPAPPVTGVEPTPAIAGVAQIRVAVRDSGRMRGGGWPAFALAAAPTREDGVVHLNGSGVAPPVVPLSPGGLSWVVGRLDLSLMPDDAAARRDEAELSLRCTAEKDAVLGNVRVRSGDPATAPGVPSGISRQAAAIQDDQCEELPGPGNDPRYDFNNDPALREIYDTPGLPDGMNLIPDDGVPMCIKGAGFFNVKKAGNAIPIATETLLRRSVETYTPIDGFTGPNYFEDRGYAFNKTFPVPGTVLGFGFMPTRAVAEAVQVRAPGAGKDAPITGNYQLFSMQPLFPPNYIEETGIDVKTYVRVQAGTASVNGVSLDLGDKCTTAPTLLSAHSFMGTQETGILKPEPGQTIIAEDIEIPAFTGCGVTEDLSPLLTASVSGAGNYANIESGQWCNFEDKSGCIDGAAAQPETFTVRPGGDVTAVAQPFTLSSLFGGQFICESATLRFPLKQAHWQARYMLTKARMSVEGCEAKGSDGTAYPVEDVTAESVYLNLVALQEDGTLSFSVNNIQLRSSVQVGGNKCTLEFANSVFDYSTFGYVEVPGYFEASYDNETGVLAATSATGVTFSPKSTCTTIPGFIVGVALGEIKGDFALRPRQSIVSP